MKVRTQVLIVVAMIIVTAQAVAAQSITINYSTHFPPGSLQGGTSVARWADEIAKQTEGRVKVRIHYSESLAKSSEVLDAIAGGVADAGLVIAGFYPAQLPLWNAVGTLHDMDLTLRLGILEQMQVARRMMRDFPELEKEFDTLGLKAMYLHASAPHAIMTKRPVRAVSDLTGLKIRTYGTGIPKMFSAIGAIPAGIPGGEIYTALSSGAVDGAYTVIDSFTSLKLDEVTGHLTLLGNGGNTPYLHIGIVTALNKRVLAKMSEKDRAVVAAVSLDNERWLAQKMLDGHNSGIEQMRKKGVKVYRLSEDELKRWREKLPNLYEEAADWLNKRGKPGSQFVETLKRVATETAARR